MAYALLCAFPAPVRSYYDFHTLEQGDDGFHSKEGALV